MTSMHIAAVESHQRRRRRQRPAAAAEAQRRRPRPAATATTCGRHVVDVVTTGFVLPPLSSHAAEIRRGAVRWHRRRQELGRHPRRLAMHSTLRRRLRQDGGIIPTLHGAVPRTGLGGRDEAGGGGRDRCDRRRRWRRRGGGLLPSSSSLGGLVAIVRNDRRSSRPMGERHIFIQFPTPLFDRAMPSRATPPPKMADLSPLHFWALGGRDGMFFSIFFREEKIIIIKYLAPSGGVLSSAFRDTASWSI